MEKKKPHTLHIFLFKCPADLFLNCPDSPPRNTLTLVCSCLHCASEPKREKKKKKRKHTLSWGIFGILPSVCLGGRTVWLRHFFLFLLKGQIELGAREQKENHSKHIYDFRHFYTLNNTHKNPRWACNRVVETPLVIHQQPSVSWIIYARFREPKSCRTTDGVRHWAPRGESTSSTGFLDI